MTLPELDLSITGPERSPITTWVLVVITLSFHYLIICAASAVTTGCSTNSKIVLHRRYIEPRAFNHLLSMLFGPLTLKRKERCGCRTISVGGARFHSACAGSHRNLVASPAIASTLARCVLNSSRAAAYAYGEIGNGNTNERTTMIDLGNFLKPCDRFYESGRLGTCEKETKGMLKGMKRPHRMPLHDVSTRQVE
jgi:hypothetical protein